jgi:hypothetical protein
MRLRLELCVVILVAAALAEILAQAPQQFRTTVTGVGVPVAVRLRGEPVPGLRGTDFVLTDSGVPQEIVAVDAASMPLDLTVVAQETVHTGAYGLATFEEEIAALAKSTRPADRFTVRFAGRDQRALMPPLPLVRKDVAAVDSGCVPVYDTLARAMIEPTASDRERVVILVAVGEGSGGFLSTIPVREIAQRANVRLYVVSVEPTISITTHRSDVAYSMCPLPAVDWSQDRHDRLRDIDRLSSPDDQWHQLWADGRDRLVEIAELTGGREVRPGVFTRGSAGPLRDVLDEIRGSYVLRYTPKGVPDAGWHPIGVKITRPGSYDLRVRAGYQR